MPGKFLVNLGATLTNSTSVNLDIAATDASGVAEMQFSNDGATWSSPEPYATTKSWTLEPGDGTKTVYVKFKDNVGNWSIAYSDSIILDTTAPTVSIASPSVAATNDTTPLLTFTASDGTVVVKVNGAAVNKVSGDSLDTLSDGSHTVRVESTDAAGNMGFAEVSFTVDTVAPSVAISPVTTPTNVSNQTITGTMEAGATVTVAVNTTATAGPVTYPSPTTWSCAITGLVDGANNIAVTATDAANNSATAATSIAYDSVAPTVSITSPAAGVTNDNTPLLTLDKGDGTAVVKVDGAIVDTASGQSLDALTDGSHTVRVESTDAAGNTGFAEVSFIIDTIVPSVSINQVTTPTNVGSQTITGNRESGATITAAVNTSASVGSVTYPTATTWSCEINGLIEGANNVIVTATDTGANSATASASIIYDVTAPGVAITSPAAAPTNDNTPHLTYTVSDGAVIVKVDGSTVSKVAGDSLDTLADGAHTVRVESTDDAGNTGFAEVTFTVDTAPPAVSINPVVTPTKLTYQTITGAMESGATVTVSVNTAATPGSVTNPTATTWSCTISNLAYGVNTIAATARDAAGNAASATASITEKTH